jgi:hypothetical protein
VHEAFDSIEATIHGLGLDGEDAFLEQVATIHDDWGQPPSEPTPTKEKKA